MRDGVQFFMARADVRGWAQLNAMSGKKRRKSRGRYVFDLPLLFINISDSSYYTYSSRGHRSRPTQE